MRYGKIYTTVDVNKNLIDAALNTVNSSELETSRIENTSSFSSRESKNFWIKDTRVLQMFLNFTNTINKNVGWDYHIDTIEPLQYTEYSSDVKGHYDWHSDQHPQPYSDNRVRKISFSILLSDDYTGGEFDIETGNPNMKDRIETINLPKYRAVFFQSEFFHRVRPVNTGLRKSLVGWILGPRFK